MATIAEMSEHPIAPYDDIDDRFYVDSCWNDKSAELRRDIPVSDCPEGAFGSYWAVITHNLISAFLRRPSNMPGEIESHG